MATIIIIIEKHMGLASTKAKGKSELKNGCRA